MVGACMHVCVRVVLMCACYGCRLHKNRKVLGRQKKSLVGDGGNCMLMAYRAGAVAMNRPHDAEVLLLNNKFSALFLFSTLMFYNVCLLLAGSCKAVSQLGSEPQCNDR